ncbi:MAG: sulfatase [Bryobacterales bacterium]|nr:sulfatase [Acidobacteriota bacterium]MCB9383904.1 sulfatase [Bryobacterales bacterium]
MRFSRRTLLTGMAASLACTMEMKRPNVLFLAADDLRDWTGFLGGYEGRVHTPNLDRLAARGVSFTNAHCASPVCCPSRTAILTGRMPSSSGIYNNGQWWRPYMGDVVTLPMQFRRNGYEAVGAGKIFHHTAGNNPPSQWDRYQRLEFRDDPWFRDSQINYPWSHPEPNPPGFPFAGMAGLPHENDWGSPPRAEAELDDVRTVDFAADFLGEAHEKPFFLACGVFRPHLPWYVPRRFFELYPLEEIELPAAPEDDLDDVPAEGRALSEARRGELLAIRAAGKQREAVQAYLASISFADEQVGRALDALDASGAADDTIVVFWSDHGWHLGEKDHWHKSTLWRQATRVPLILAGPGIAAGATCAEAVSLVDLYPTLNELCGFAPMAENDGESLAALLSDPAAARERPAVIEFDGRHAAVCDERYRYIRYGDGGEELYDHDQDPNEWTNLAGDPAQAETKRALARWLPARWAEPAPKKGAYAFDPESYSWTVKATGEVIRGDR